MRQDPPEQDARTAPGGGPRAARSGVAAAYAALAFLALVWGYSWVATKVATHYASPLAVAWGRTALGALALLTVLRLTGRTLRPTPLAPTLVLGLLQTTGFTILQTLAVSAGGAGKAAVLAYTMPLWLALLAWPFLGERIGRLRWAALALAASGLALIATPLQVRSLAATALPVAAGLVWAASAVWAIRMCRPGRSDLLSLTAWQMAWGAAAMAPFALLLPIEVRWTAPFVAAMGFLVLLATALGWALWLFILSRLPATAAGVGSLATPVVGVTIAALQLHELPSARELGGMLCIVVALGANALASSVRGARA